jgi:NAD(P)H-dependent FMN reductase
MPRCCAPRSRSAPSRRPSRSNRSVYDGDVEAAQGIPARAAELKERIAAADALLLVTPEYNNSIPGVFKNAIDWLTRRPRTSHGCSRGARWD